MAHICKNCGTETNRDVGPYEYVECGLRGVTIHNCQMDVCPDCRFVYPELPNPKAAKQAIVRALIESECALWGDAILFLRKAIGVTAQAFAEMLRVDRITVSRWENNRSPIGGAADFRLRLCVVEKLFRSNEQPAIIAEINRVIKVTYRPGEGRQSIALNAMQPPTPPLQISPYYDGIYSAVLV